MLKNLRHLLGYCRPQRKLYFAGIAALLFVDLLDTFTPKITQWVIDHLTLETSGTRPSNPLVTVLPDSWYGPGSAVGGMWTYGVLLSVIVALTGVFRYVMSISFAKAGIRLIHVIRGRFFAHLQRLDASFHDTSKVGDHMSRATNDTDACRMFYGIGLLLLLDTAIYFLMVPAYMMSISWKLMLASMLTLPLIPLIVARLSTLVEERFEKVQEQFSTLSERARESFAGAKVIKSFAREDAEVRSFAKLAREYVSRSLSFARVLALEVPSLTLLLGLADLMVVVYGGSLVIRGEITVGEFAAFFQYLIRLSGPMIGLGWVVTLYQRARVSMTRIEEVMALEPGIKEPEGAEPVERFRGEVRVDHLTFRYGEETEPALRDVSLAVAPGATLGIVGPVGSGKSTLLNLLPRLYDPPPGTVFIDGKDVRELPLEALRTRIGPVPQDTFLFGEKVRANIALGHPRGEPREGAVEEAARLARVDEEIRALPAGYETLLGERGVNLSGGQKQRVAIARALTRDPDLLLLDDCLSSVDTETESAILANLRTVIRGRTTIIVSHRVSTVKDADEIIVIQGGRITERGTHEALVRANGYYADLYRRQKLGGEI